ncbi:hypothetical protein [Terrabacter sp. NPDC080008]|uniref:hypothetical protein n=1 Tax=Terrabacter sp. NPDC080008 TaxID=3155176 RepID=UPI00344E5C32
MTTSTVSPPRAATTATAAAARASGTGRAGATDVLDRVPLLALLTPLVLFGHGIVAWVDGLDQLDQLRRPGTLDDLGPLGGLVNAREQGALTVAAGILLVVAVGGFAWLTMALGRQLRHLPVATPAALLASFGAGATAAVSLGHVSGLLGSALPPALTWGGPVLTAAGLGLVLTALTVEGRLPVGSLALAGLAGVVLAVPWGLLPLGSLLLLIALGPLTRAPEPSAELAKS